MQDSARLSNLVYGFCTLIILILVVQWVLPPRMPEVEVPAPVADCFGKPLAVDYPYNGTVNEPWACQAQCEDGIQRYLVYTNNTATQCQALPGCNDTGEDSGVTCRIPLSTPVSAAKS